MKKIVRVGNLEQALRYRVLNNTYFNLLKALCTDRKVIKGK